MMRFAALLALTLLAACVPGEQPNRGADAARVAEAPPQALVGGPVCRVGPEGEPVDAEPRIADRGIGGTGAPPAVVAERGIGGTGVVGVVTGFASVCVDGLEIHLDRSSVVEIDGVTAPASLLRAGQVVAVRTGGTGRLFAEAIAVRREVSGRIDGVELGSGTLTIAGQPVSVPPGTWGADSARLGDWVTVSGLRRADGTVVASRLDAAAAGTFMARGAVQADGGVVRVGQLVLDPATAAGLKPGVFVQVSGHYAGGQAKVGVVASDTLFPEPISYFGKSVNHLIVQGFVHVANGAIQVNGVKLAADPALHGNAGADAIAVVSLDRKADGSFAAVGLRYTDSIAPGAGTSRLQSRGARGDSNAAPAARRSGGTVVASVTDAGVASPVSAPSVAASAHVIDSAPALPPSAGSPPGTLAVTAPLVSLERPSVSALEKVLVTAPKRAPSIVPVTAPVTARVGAEPAETGSSSLGSKPAANPGTSDLVSHNASHNGGGSANVAARESGGSGGVRAMATGQRVITGGSTSHSGTISLVTGGGSTSGTSGGSGHTGVGSVSTSGGKTPGAKSIGTSSGQNATSGGGRQHGH